MHKALGCRTGRGFMNPRKSVFPLSCLPVTIPSSCMSSKWGSIRCSNPPSNPPSGSCLHAVIHLGTFLNMGLENPPFLVDGSVLEPIISWGCVIGPLVHKALLVAYRSVRQSVVRWRVPSWEDSDCLAFVFHWLPSLLFFESFTHIILEFRK